MVSDYTRSKKKHIYSSEKYGTVYVYFCIKLEVDNGINEKKYRIVRAAIVFSRDVQTPLMTIQYRCSLRAYAIKGAPFLLEHPFVSIAERTITVITGDANCYFV